jgi:nucleotide-binding universal stress UspA family protein
LTQVLVAQRSPVVAGRTTGLVGVVAATGGQGEFTSSEFADVHAVRRRWADALHKNLMTAVLPFEALAPSILDTRGRVVLISSTSSVDGLGGRTRRPRQCSTAMGAISPSGWAAGVSQSTPSRPGLSPTSGVRSVAAIRAWRGSARALSGRALRELRVDVAEQLTSAPYGWTYHASHGDPGHLLAAVAGEHNALILVLGARHGLDAAFGHLLGGGSVPRDLFRHGPRPVLLVPRR